MKNLTIAAVVVFAYSLTLVAETARPVVSAEASAVKAARIAEKKRTMLGPKVIKPNSMKGTIAVLSAQQRVPLTDFETAISSLQKPSRFNVAIKTVAAPAVCDCKTFQHMKATAAAEVAVIVIDNPDYPVMIAAPEDQWAVVNVAKLEQGLPEGDAIRKRMLAGRTRREVARALAHACGGIGSMFENNMMDAVKIDELDTVNEFIPVDVMNRLTTYLEKIGVTPAYEKYYYFACKEGWAQTPTNDIEKAIWNRVKDQKERGPTNPILIKPKKAK